MTTVLMQMRKRKPAPRAVSNLTGLSQSAKKRFEPSSEQSFDNVCIRYNSSRPAGLGAHAYARGEAPVQMLTDGDTEWLQTWLLALYGFPYRGKLIELLIRSMPGGIHTRNQFMVWLQSLSPQKALEYVREQVEKESGQKTVITFGDQELLTAMQAIRSRYVPFATSLDFNGYETDVKDRQEEIRHAGGLHTQHVMLHGKSALRTDGNGSTGGQGVYSRHFLRLRARTNRAKSIAAIDHPYTRGVHTNPNTRKQVKALCDSIFAFASDKKIGRVRIMVRAIDKGRRSTLGVYSLRSTVFYPYKLQRTGVTRHATTVSSKNHKTSPINPSKQSLVIKYGNFKVLFSVLYELAAAVLKEPEDEQIRAAFNKRLNMDLGNYRMPAKLKAFLTERVKGFPVDTNDLLECANAICNFDPANEYSYDELAGSGQKTALKLLEEAEENQDDFSDV